MTGYSQSNGFGTGRLLDAAKNHPEGLLLLAAGCALLMRSGSSSQSGVSSKRGAPYERENSSYRSAAGAVSDAAESARNYVSDATDKMTDAAGSYARSLSDYTESARDTVTEESGRLAQRAQSVFQDTVSRVVEERPLAVAVAGLAAGAALAVVFPTTDIEKHALGPAGERVADIAGKTGEQLKEATSRAGEKLADAAEKRGLSVDGLKEVAREAAETFGSTMSGEAAKAGGDQEKTSEGRKEVAANHQHEGQSGSQASGRGQAASQNKTDRGT